MKKFFCLIFVLAFGIACDKNETDSEINAADITSIKSTMTNGEWRVSYYFDSEKEETTDYAGYRFTFNGDGVLSVTDGNTSLSGAWSITDSGNSSDDSKDDSELDFNILFNGSELFEELSDDWDIKTYSSTKIELVDISGGDGSVDYLTFDKM